MDALDLALEEGGFGAYVAFGNSQDPDVLYLTRFSVTDPVLYIRRRGERGVIVVPQMECERAAKEADAVVISREEAGFFEIAKEERDSWRVLARVIGRQVPVGPVLVPANFPYALGSELAREKQVGVDRDAVHRMREVKTAREIGSIRHVQHACDRAMERALLVIRKAKARKGLLFQGAVPLTSSLVRSAIHQVLVRNGCIPGETIVSCGEETAMPHRRGDGQLTEDEPIVIDIFPRDQETGYFTDMTRTVCRGSSPRSPTCSAPSATPRTWLPGSSGRVFPVRMCTRQQSTSSAKPGTRAGHGGSSTASGTASASRSTSCRGSGRRAVN